MRKSNKQGTTGLYSKNNLASDKIPLSSLKLLPLFSRKGFLEGWPRLTEGRAKARGSEMRPLFRFDQYNNARKLEVKRGRRSDICVWSWLFLSGIHLIFSPLQMAEMFRKNFEMGSQRAAKWQKGNLKVAVESFFS